MDEGRDVDAAIARPRAHGELVAEVACSGFAHTGDAQVLAQERDDLDVEVVERRDAAEVTRAREVADRVDHGATVGKRGHGEDLVDAVARPGLGEQGLEREQDDVASFCLALLEELVALEVAGKAEDDPAFGGITLGDDVRVVIHGARRVLEEPLVCAQIRALDEPLGRSFC